MTDKLVVTVGVQLDLVWDLRSFFMGLLGLPHIMAPEFQEQVF